MFLKKCFITNFTFNETAGIIVHDNFSLLKVNLTLRIKSISHCVDISYIFLYLIFRPFIHTLDTIKTVTLFVKYTHL